MKSTIEREAIEAIVQGRHGQPFDVLGPHSWSGGKAIRTFLPYVHRVEVVDVDTGAATPMDRVHPDGFFEAVFPERAPSSYRFRYSGDDGHVWEAEDPYRFALQITDFDLHLFGEGTHYRTYEKMGAHLVEQDGVTGVRFAVWAPNALRVGVIGAFNRWDGRIHPMQRRGDSGLWELFVPGLKSGDLYKFDVVGPNNYRVEKADPFAFASELRPKSASVVWDLTQYAWTDSAWMKERATRQWYQEPISVYEVHLGSWRRVQDDENRWLSYRELTETLIPYVKEMGYTHIELLPISEHPFDGSWGYQTIGYYAPTSRFGTPDDFMYFVDQCHQAGIGVLLDWVPAHFPKDEHGLAYFDGTHLYEHADPRKGEHTDWGTLIFNYGRNEVRTFLLSNIMYWADVFHIDGVRVDAVASMLYLDYSRNEGEWIPNQYGGNENLEAVDFLKTFNEIVHAEYPGFLTFAEESTAWPMVSRPTYLGGLGFGMKWNMGWMHDTLEYFSKDPIHRKYHHNNITFSLLYAFTENFILPFSHDEVVHGKGSMLDKMPGDVWQKFANVRLLYAYMFAHPGKKLLFMGLEFGQWNEWNAYESLQWHLLEEEAHRRLKDFVRDLNLTYRRNKALYHLDFTWEGFDWIDYHDSEQSVVSFMRKTGEPEEVLICVFNFTPVPRHDYFVRVPQAGTYVEIVNSDSAMYGGSNVGNGGAVNAQPIEGQEGGYCVHLTLPPLAAIYLKPTEVPQSEKAKNETKKVDK